MTHGFGTPEGLRSLLRQGPSQEALARMTGDTAAQVRVERTHFNSDRPVQIYWTVTGPDGAPRPLIAEWHGETTDLQARRERASLRKSRRAVRLRREPPPLVADTVQGLLLRLPGVDPRLLGLRIFHRRREAAALIERLEATHPGKVKVDLVAHRLGKRAVLRLRCADGRVRYARIRTTKSDAGRRSFARHCLLWQALERDTLLRIPRPLGYDEATGVALYDVLAGHPPELTGDDAARNCRAVAGAIGRLQALDLPDLKRHGAEDEIRLLEEWLTRTRAVFPERAEVLGDVAAGLFAELRACPPVPLLPCHRDLHEKQILLHHGNAGLLDFDTLCLADPCLDLGNLQAHLTLDALRRGHSSAAAESILAAALPQLPPSRTALWRRLALLRLAMIYLFTDEPPLVIDALIKEAGT
jgi:hypothetical protein